MGAFVVNWMQMNIRGDRMKRLLLLLACLLALCTGVCAAEPVISEMKTDCILTGSSSCQVTQSFTLEISGAQTQLRFPLSAGAKKASVAGYQTQKQTDGDCPVLVLTDANGFTKGGLACPKYYFMAVLSETDGAYHAIGFRVEHKEYSKAPTLEELKASALSIDELEEKTGIDFFCNLPDDLENTVESSMNLDDWAW